MTHDFAKKRAPNQAPRVPSWVWIFTSLVACTFIAFVYYLANIASEAEDFTRQLEQQASLNLEKPKPTPHHAIKPSEGIQKDKSAMSGPRFTFYDELARLKMVPREVEKFFPRLSKEEKKKEALKKREATQNKVAEKKENTLIRYMLQTGSFQNESDADRRRAELILMGMDANIKTVTFTNGQIWHRVIVGPFTGEKALHRAQNQLTQLNIAAAVRKVDE